MKKIKGDKCFICKNKRNIGEDCHILCAKPDRNLKANPIGIQGGWFNYPRNFDPSWIISDCKNFEKKERNNAKG